MPSWCGFTMGAQGGGFTATVCPVSGLSVFCSHFDYYVPEYEGSYVLSPRLFVIFRTLKTSRELLTVSPETVQ